MMKMEEDLTKWKPNKIDLYSLCNTKQIETKTKNKSYPTLLPYIGMHDNIFMGKEHSTLGKFHSTI